MTGCIHGRVPGEVKEKVHARTRGKHSREDLLERGMIIGTSPQIQEQIEHLAEAGVQRVMLQWLDLDDLAGLEAMAKNLL
jgi:hypothetical protein